MKWLIIAGLLLGTLRLAAAVDDPLQKLGVTASSGAASGYLPDATCATCHAGIAASYREVGMSRSFAHASSANLIEDFDDARFFHAKSGRHYEMQRRGEALWFRRWREEASGEAVDVFEIEVDWILGSGNRARSYLYQTDAGELYQLPIGWYSEAGKWAMSPGFDLPRHDGVGRRVRRECMFCHNAFPEVAVGSDRRHGPHLFPEDLPEGTGCQRCHGPGAEHVRAVLAGEPIETIHRRIVNPGKLPWPRRNDACLQCHLLPAVEVIGPRRMDRGDYSFRPGEALADYLLHVDIDSEDAAREDRFQINHHGYRLLQSDCYTGSNGEMGCVSCHDPHEKVKPEQRLEWYRDRCLACHQDFSHANDPAVLAAAAADRVASDDCARCHMPQRRTQDVVEVSMTDHRIARGPFDREALLAPIDRDLPVITGLGFHQPSSAPLGAEATAYLALTTLTLGATADALDALDRTVPALARGDAGADWLLALADAELRQGRIESALQTLDRLGAEGARSHEVAVLRGGVALQQGNTALAIELLRPLLDRARFQPGTHFNMGLAQRAAGNHAAAIESFRRALQQRPVMAAAWLELARSLTAVEQRADAREALQHALSIEPDLAPARLLLKALGSTDTAPR